MPAQTKTPRKKLTKLEQVPNVGPAIAADLRLLGVAQPICPAATAISARDATFTPSRNAPATGDRRSRGTSGLVAATSTNAGRKMPAVAAAAPSGPASK